MSDTYWWILATAIAVAGVGVIFWWPKASGPPLVLLVDRSGSTVGEISVFMYSLCAQFQIWAQRDGRDLKIVQFDHKVISTAVLPQGRGAIQLSMPNGGTAYAPALERAKDLVKPGSTVVLITDGVGMDMKQAKGVAAGIWAAGAITHALFIETGLFEGKFPEQWRGQILEVADSATMVKVTDQIDRVVRDMTKDWL